MFTIDVDSYICSIRDNFLKNEPAQYDINSKVITKNGLMVKVELSIEDGNIYKSTSLWTIMCGNTNVFMAHNEAESKIPKFSEFKNVSNHDSCWRSEIRNYIYKIYFQFAREINKNKRPADMNSNCMMIFNEIKEVYVKYKSNDDYFNDLVGIENK